MAVVAIKCAPGNRTRASQRGTVTHFYFAGEAANSVTLYAASANEVIVVDYFILQAVSGGTWGLGVGNTTDASGLIQKIEGINTATQAISGSAQNRGDFHFEGGGSTTASENNVLLNADGAGLCHYAVAGYRYSNA